MSAIVIEATRMKDVSKISKSFTCECGTVNKFEFETDFDVHDVTMAVRCQMCSREKNISLMSFFRRNVSGQEQSAVAQPAVPSIFDNPTIPVGDIIASTEQSAAPQEETVVVDQVLNPPMTVQQKQPNREDEEDLSYEEKEAFSDLFGKL